MVDRSLGARKEPARRDDIRALAQALASISLRLDGQRAAHLAPCVTAYPVRPGLAAPRGRTRPRDAAAPTRLTKKGTSPLVSEVGWTRPAPVRSQGRKGLRMDSRKIDTK